MNEAKCNEILAALLLNKGDHEAKAAQRMTTFNADDFIDAFSALREAVGLLEMWEWSGYVDDSSAGCPECAGYMPQQKLEADPREGHAEDCYYGAFLARWKGEAP